MSEFTSRNKKLLLFCLVVAVNMLVKLLGISYNQVALDEPFSIYHAQFSIGHIYHTLVQGNNPPLYEFFLHYWIRVFGTDVFWVRLPSVMFSSLAAGFWFLAATHGMGLWTSLGCALLFTFSTQYIYFSHEARSYSMLLMLLAISVYLWVRVWKGERSMPLILSAAVCSALCVYVHYLAVIPIGLLLLLTLLRSFQKPYGKMFFYVLSTAVLLIPVAWLVMQRVQAVRSSGLWGTQPSWTQLYGFLNIFLNGRITLAVLLCCLFVSFLLLVRKREHVAFRRELFDVSVWGIIFGLGYIGMFAISYRQPVFIERYVQVVMPFFFLALAAWFSFLMQRFPTAKFFWLAVLLVFCVQVDLYPKNERAPKQVADAAEGFIQDAGGIVLISPDHYQINFSYYFGALAFSSAQMEHELNKDNIYPVSGKIGAEETVLQKRNPWDKVLFIDAGEHFLTGKQEILDYLSGTFALEKKDSVDKQTTLYYFNNNNAKP